MSCDEIPHVEVGACWERPADAPGWTVPIADVEAKLRDICGQYYVREIVADPFRWARSLEELREEGLPVEEYSQSLVEDGSGHRTVLRGRDERPANAFR